MARCALLLASLALGTLGQKCNNAEPGDYDFLLFVTQWTGAVPEFTIHGLWPNNADGANPPYPCYCPNDNEFEVSDFDEKLQEGLHARWFSYKNGKLTGPEGDITFWEYEWTKHGTCMTMEPVAFFQTALNLLTNQDKNFDLKPVLVNLGLQPGKELEVRLADFNAALAKKGWSAVVACWRNSNEVQEVRLCLDKNLNAIPCGRSVLKEGTCRDDTIVFKAAGGVDSDDGNDGTDDGDL